MLSEALEAADRLFQEVDRAPRVDDAARGNAAHVIESSRRDPRVIRRDRSADCRTGQLPAEFLLVLGFPLDIRRSGGHEPDVSHPSRAIRPEGSAPGRVCPCHRNAAFGRSVRRSRLPKGLNPRKSTSPGLEDQGSGAPNGGLGAHGSALPCQVCVPSQAAFIGGGTAGAGVLDGDLRHAIRHSKDPVVVILIGFRPSWLRGRQRGRAIRGAIEYRSAGIPPGLTLVRDVLEPDPFRAAALAHLRGKSFQFPVGLIPNGHTAPRSRRHCPAADGVRRRGLEASGFALGRRVLRRRLRLTRSCPSGRGGRYWRSIRTFWTAARSDPSTAEPQR